MWNIVYERCKILFFFIIVNFHHLIYGYSDLLIHLFYEIQNLFIINEVNFFSYLKENLFW